MLENKNGIKIIGNKENKVSIGLLKNVPKSTVVKFKGTGNKLVIHDNVYLGKCTFNFFGNNATIEIHANCKINGNFLVADNAKISIGKGTKINGVVRLHCGEHGDQIIIGEKCLLASVRFRTSDQHSIIDLETRERVNKSQSIIIEDAVWIAEDVNVYKGSVIGKGSIIGARSTVVGLLPPNSLCVGTPAKAVKQNVSWLEKFI